jgi:hypothetical protein
MYAQHEHHSLNKVAFSATIHCFTGCAIGEVLGMIIGTALHWSNLSTIILAVALAFIFGYVLTLIPLIKHGLNLKHAFGLALASDTVSITIMEIVDNGIMFLIPGAMDAHLNDPFFWISLAVALAIAFVVVLPVNRWLIKRGKGHAVVHAYH